jgi:hypothetical protein
LNWTPAAAGMMKSEYTAAYKYCVAAVSDGWLTAFLSHLFENDFNIASCVFKA